MADTKEAAVAYIVAQVADLDLDDLVYLHCTHKFPKDETAEDACRPETLKVTQSLIADLPDLAGELVAPAFVPVRAQEGRPGGSQFGGIPSLPAGFDWPLSEHYTIGDAYKDVAPTSFKQLFKRKKPLPMTFIAQIALAEVSGLDPDLPDTGRLMIFMDHELWAENGPSGIRIVWDQTPEAELALAEAPETLVTLDELARIQHEEMEAESAALVEDFLKDLDVGDSSLADSIDPRDDDEGEEDAEPPEEEGDETFSSFFLPPQIPVTFSRVWLPLNHHASETAGTAYAQRVAGTGAVDVLYEAEVLSPEGGAADMPPYHQVLGKPIPEQSDPRHAAIERRLLGRANESHEDYALMKEKAGIDTDEQMIAYMTAQASEYVLLLQLDVASFIDMSTEGTTYILLHRDDLAARRFENAIAIYQQT